MSFMFDSRKFMPAAHQRRHHAQRQTRHTARNGKAADDNHHLAKDLFQGGHAATQIVMKLNYGPQNASDTDFAQGAARFLPPSKPWRKAEKFECFGPWRCEEEK